MKLIVGLGNPGKDYAHTRHNIGADAVKLFAESLSVSLKEKTRFSSEIAEGILNDEKIILALPLTYMNRSGEAVQALVSFYKLDISAALIVHDEMDYVLGQFAFCAQAGPAGHNGIRSIQESLSTERISRLRLGIGRPTSPIAKEDYVLQRFATHEQPIVDEVLKKSQQAIKDWVEQGDGESDEYVESKNIIFKCGKIRRTLPGRLIFDEMKHLHFGTSGATTEVPS